MRTPSTQSHLVARLHRARVQSAGFSLLELLVAMVVFLIVAGAAFTLVRQHMPLFNSQQQQAGLNIATRNVIAQMQIDVVNAGTGFYQGINIATWPIGVTILNNPLPPGTDCRTATTVNGTTTYTYGANCFDQLNVIAIDPTTPPAHPDAPAADVANSSILAIVPTGTTTLSDLASHYKTGDEVLVVSATGDQMTTTILTKGGQVTGGDVHLQHNPTGADGSNCQTTIFCSADPLGISSSGNNKLGFDFDTGAWVLKLAPISYWVDTTDPTNPKLMRTALNPATGKVESVVMAEQVIGFKVGVALRDTSPGVYLFKACNDLTACDYRDFSSVRSVLVSLIVRTPPGADSASTYRNSFDHGPYRIQATSVVINPRNLMFQP